MIKRITLQQIEQLIQEELSNLGKYLIEEEYSDSFCNRMYLTEEQSIAEIIKQITPQIYNELSAAIMAEFPNAETAVEQGAAGKHEVTKCECEPYVNLFGIETDVSLSCINFKNKADFDDVYKQNGEYLFNAYSWRKDNPYRKTITQNITLKFVAINGQILKEQAINSIEHEISHIYDQYKMGSPYPRDDGYGNAKGKLSESNDIIRSLANILYFGGDGEVSGFANGLYGELKAMFENGYTLTRKLLYGSSTYDNVRKLEDSVRIIEEAQKDPSKLEQIRQLLKDWHAKYSCYSIVNFGKKLIKLYERAVGRVWNQICKDCQIMF